MESVNIGVVVEAGVNGERSTECKFAESLTRAAKLDPSLKSVAVERIVRGAIEQIGNECNAFTLADFLENYSGGKIQFTQPRVTILDDLKSELAQLFEQFVIDELEEREHGKTENILKREVREVLVGSGIDKERVTYSSSKKRLILQGRHTKHSFDISIKVNSHDEFVECISFDVEQFNAKLDAAKVLIYDAKDIKASNKRIDIFSILYPPKLHRQKEANEAFEEAKAILKEEKIEPYDFDSTADTRRLLERVAAK
jgi:hypothetical protein